VVAADTAAPEESAGNPRLALLLAMAMFVLVVDTSLMNVSISAVVRDLDTTALAGLLNSFRMMRLPELEPSSSVEGMAW
jgi:hypothetical protein